MRVPGIEMTYIGEIFMVRGEAPEADLLARRWRGRWHKLKAFFPRMEYTSSELQAEVFGHP
jgi:hypothetical protein